MAMMLKYDHPEEKHNEWIHPFECNELHTKLVILRELAYHGDLPCWDIQHIEVCRQIGGGC